MIDPRLTEVRFYAEMSIGWLDRATAIAPPPVELSTPQTRERMWRLLALRSASAIPLPWLTVSVEFTESALDSLRVLRQSDIGHRFERVETLVAQNLSLMHLILAARSEIAASALEDIDAEFRSEHLWDAVGARYPLQWASTMDADTLKGWQTAWRSAVTDITSSETSDQRVSLEARPSNDLWLECTIREMDEALRQLRPV